MNERVERFLSDKEALLQKREKERRDGILQAVGLVEETREYVPEGMVLYGVGYSSGTVDGAKRYYKSTTKPMEVSDEEFRRIEAALEREKEQEALLAAEKKAKEAAKAGKDAKKQFTEIEFLEDAPEEPASGAAIFLHVLAWVLWIGGLIVAIMLSRVSVEVESYYSVRTETQFNWGNFIAMAVAYGAAGGLAMVVAEISENLARIASRFSKAQIRIATKDGPKDDPTY